MAISKATFYRQQLAELLEQQQELQKQLVSITDRIAKLNAVLDLEKYLDLTSKNFSLIKTAKNHDDEYECAICEQPFENPEQVCWAGIEQYNSEDGNPLCLYCCKELVKENESSDDDSDSD